MESTVTRHALAMTRTVILCLVPAISVRKSLFLLLVFYELTDVLRLASMSETSGAFYSPNLNRYIVLYTVHTKRIQML